MVKKKKMRFSVLVSRTGSNMVRRIDKKSGGGRLELELSVRIYGVYYRARQREMDVDII